MIILYWCSTRGCRTHFAYATFICHHYAICFAKFGGIKENVEVVRSFDWWTVVIGVLIAIGIVMLCVKIKDFVVSTFGITTKSALAKQAQEERIKDLNNQIIDLQKEIQQFKDNRTNDREQSFDIQKQLTDSQTLLQNSVENLRKMLVNKEINDMRWEILDFSNAVMNGRVYNKEIYDHIFDTYTEYERVLEENGLENGKVDSSMQFVRNKYLELMEKSFKQ